jgi:hypothetical protein
MKNNFRAILLVLLISTVASADIIKVLDFPDKPEFKYKEHYIDLGYHYNQKTFFYFIPIWNSDEEFVGYINEKEYLPLKKKQLDNLLQISNLQLPKEDVLSWWDRYIGKAVAIAIVIGLAVIGFTVV